MEILHIIKKRDAKGLVIKLASPHVQSAWEFWEEMIQTAGLAVCCNYLSKKKKKDWIENRLKFKD